LSISWLNAEPGPALVVHPPGAVSLDDAHAAIELWEFYSGKQLDDVQRLAVEHMMAVKPDGMWAARTTGRAVSRQNGKGDEIEVVEFWDLTQRGAPIVHSAHEIPTAKSAHMRLVGLIQGHADLRRKLKQVRYANGDQSVEMLNGGIVAYRTRTAGGGRGLDDIARLVVDEAQHAQPEQLASSTPILAVNPNPQTNFTGSAGIEAKSVFWWGLRKRALAGDGGDFAWLEHSAEKVELNRDGRVVSTPPDVSDREAWARANPAFPERISAEFLAEQLGVLGPRYFAREHLCVWDPADDGESGVVPYDTWLDLVDSASTPTPSSVAYGLAVAPDGVAAAVSSSGRRVDGLLHVDTVRWGEGTDWIVPYLIELFQRKRLPIRINPAGPEGAFIRRLTEADVDVVQVTGREYQQACGEFLDAVKNRVLRHIDQRTMNRSVAAAGRRDVGQDGGWVWVRLGVTDISPLAAATSALSGVMKRDKPGIW
jgi:hypothetical protein